MYGNIVKPVLGMLDGLDEIPLFSKFAPTDESRNPPGANGGTWANDQRDSL